MMFGRTLLRARLAQSYPKHLVTWDALQVVPAACAAVHSTQVRHAGHSKWQNRAPIKALQAANRNKHMNRFARQLKTHYKLTKSTDPKKDATVARIMALANKASVGKSVAEFLKKLETRGDLKEVEEYRRGPSQSALIIQGYTDKPKVFKDAINSLFKKKLPQFQPATNVSGVFRNEGEIFVPASPSSADKEDESSNLAVVTSLTLEQAEELAIECEAEDVCVEADEHGQEFYKFTTSAADLYKVKDALESRGCVIDSCGHVHVPEFVAEVDDVTLEAWYAVEGLLEGVDDFEQVVHNMKPKED